MNQQKLNKNDKNTCVLFFNGWGMNASILPQTEDLPYHICMMNDYTEINFDEAQFAQYESIFVIAWSLGVWVASNVLANTKLCINKAIAINGTENPINKIEGIDTAIFKGTIHGWDEKNRQKFNLRMMGNKTLYQTYESRLTNTACEDQKNELQAMENQINQQKTPVFKWDTAIIGLKDAIFLSQNQINYWQEKTIIKTVDMPHFPFVEFDNWNKLLNL